MKRFAVAPLVIFLFLGCIEEEVKLQNVESCDAEVVQGNWDDDTEYDGILITVVLRDQDEYPILFDDVEITVTITIKSENIEIYEGIFRVYSWEEKIQIPFEKLIAKVERGDMEIKVRMPDKRELKVIKEFQI